MAKQKSEKEQSKNTKSTSRRKKSKGLGDTIEKVFDNTGVSKVAKWVLGDDCGCEARRDYLNSLFPYVKPKCLNEEQYNVLDKHFRNRKNTVSVDEQKKIIEVYNHVFSEKANTTSCSPCFRNNILQKLEKIYINYRDEFDKE